MNRTHYILFTASFILLLGIVGCSKKQPEPTQPMPEIGAEAGPKAISSIIEITAPEQFVQALSLGKPTIIKFFATWCPPCRRMAPLFEAVAEMFKDQATFAAVNIDIEAMRPIVEDLAKEGVPTFCFFDKNGSLVNRHPGGYEETEFRMVINDFIQKAK